MGDTPRASLGVILAAGGGRRMGIPKALLRRGEVPLVRAHALAFAPHCDRVVVAIGAAAGRVAEAVAGFGVVENPAWARTGPIDSLACALRARPPSGAVLVGLVDTPPPSDATLRALLGARPPAVPAYRGRAGHPVLLDRDTALAVARDPHPDGLRAMLTGAVRVPVDAPDVALDFDTPRAWEAFAARG